MTGFAREHQMKSTSTGFWMVRWKIANREFSRIHLVAHPEAPKTICGKPLPVPLWRYVGPMGSMSVCQNCANIEERRLKEEGE